MSLREREVNKHLWNSIVHTAEKNSSGTASQTVLFWTGMEQNGCVHTSLRNGSRMVRTVLPVQCERSISCVGVG